MLYGIQELGATYTLPKDGTNPVRKIPLLVTGSDSEVIIDVLDDGLDGGVEEGGIEEYRRQLRLKDQQVRLLTNEVSHLRREVADARADQDRQFSLLHKHMLRMGNNVARIANRPAKRRRIEAAEAALPAAGDAFEDVVAAEAPPPREILVAKLSDCPRQLHDLWLEYEVGFTGRKAAKDFTDKERGADKYRYYRRNVFWLKWVRW